MRERVRHRPRSSKQVAKPWEAVKGQAATARDELATRFVASLAFDRRLYKYDIAGSMAHARMLEGCGLISKRDLDQISRGLKAIEKQIDAAGDNWPGWKLELEDVHMCIEAALIGRTGDAGRKLHTGRSRNDQVALDLQLWMNDVVRQLDAACLRLIKAFVTLAERDGTIVMPAYTHLQRAQPIVAGGELMAWVTAIDRCRRRLELSRSLGDRNPLGCGAVAGSALPLDRRRVGALLRPGGWRQTINAIDTTATRDGAIDFVYSLSMIAMTLSRWAEQWIIYTSAEFGFIRLDPRYTTGSSMMPQKQNPDVLELIRGRTGSVYGHLMALLTICKGLPIGYNRDIQEDKRCVFAAYDCVVENVDMAARIVETTRFDGQATGAAVEVGFLDATSLAEYLVTKNVPFRTAHQIVGTLVNRCQSQGLSALAQLSTQDLNEACAAFGVKGRAGPEVQKWLGAANVVRRYRTLGNAGMQGFKQQLRRWQRLLQRDTK